MQELEKILGEIGELRGQAGSECTSEDHYIKKAWEHCLDRVVGIILKHMNDGWIPVEERLPTKEERKKDNNNFLVQVDSGERFSCEYDPEANGYDNPQWCCNIPVVAWRPLPEPYHPERSDKNDGE